MAAVIQVRGINELSRAWRAVDADIPKRTRLAMLAIARMVVGTAQQKATADFKHPTGQAASSVRPRATRRGAGIAFGGQAAPYFPWLDFGGTVGRGHRPGVKGSGSIERDWRGTPFGSGRYVYPAIFEHDDDIKRMAEEAVMDANRAAGFEAH
jgi:hypothetical protein